MSSTTNDADYAEPEASGPILALWLPTAIFGNLFAVTWLLSGFLLQHPTASKVLHETLHSSWTRLLGLFGSKGAPPSRTGGSCTSSDGVGKSYAASQATRKIGGVCWQRNDGADRSELVTRPLADLPGFNFHLSGRTDKWVNMEAPAQGSRPLEEGAPPKHSLTLKYGEEVDVKSADSISRAIMCSDDVAIMSVAPSDLQTVLNYLEDSCQ